MDLDFAAGRLTPESHRGVLALILAGMFAALIMAVAAPAQATPKVAKAWGFNKDGELGNGTETTSSDVPVAVSGLKGVTALSGGSSHSLALLENGTVMAWGDNSSGQLGNGTTARSDVPVPVSGLNEVTAIAAGAHHSLALLKNGTVMAWGQNEEGQLGSGTTTNSDVPVAVSGLKEVTAIAAGEVHSLALLKNGTVMAWGSNTEDQLGNGTTRTETEFTDVPVAVSKLSRVTAISAGGRHSLARVSDGTVVAWGYNVAGQLGNGTTENSDVPVAVSKLSGVSGIAAGSAHSLALLANSTVMAWGYNVQGQLGNGTSAGPETCGTTTPFACSKIPVAVSGLSGVSAISGGGNHSLALLSNRTVDDWGANGSGQLGDGTTSGPEACGPFGSCSAKPVAVCAAGPESPCPTGPVLVAVNGIAAGEDHSLAIVEPPPPPGLPELGRCVPSAKKAGEWKGTICNHLSPTHKGTHNWLPGAEKKKFNGSGNGGVTTLATAKTTISCSTALIAGEYTNAKAVTATLDLKGCVNAATEAKCQSSPAQEGEIESTRPLEGELGFIKNGTRPSIGLDLKKSSTAPNLASFYCGSGPAPELQGTVEGSVIGQIKRVNRMTSAFTLSYKATKGKQLPEFFEGGPNDTLAITFVKGAEPPTTESAALATTVSITNEEPLEIKANTYPS